MGLGASLKIQEPGVRLCLTSSSELAEQPLPQTLPAQGTGRALGSLPRARLAPGAIEP